MDSDHLSVAQRSMELGGGGWGGQGVRGEWGSGARLNMWPTVTETWLNMQPFYLLTENTHTPLVPVTRPLLTNGWFWCEPGDAETAVSIWIMHLDSWHIHWLFFILIYASMPSSLIEIEKDGMMREGRGKHSICWYVLYLAHCGSRSDETRTKHSGAR